MPMRLRGVAYDMELLAEVQRRPGGDIVELSFENPGSTEDPPDSDD
jgi:hypothetical protein